MVTAVDDAIASLTANKKNTRCSELVSVLTSLGFKVRRGSSGGHRVFSHSKLVGFMGGNFNGGHGADDVVKSVYVQKVINILSLYQSQL
jgi:hypothetical protein